MEEVLSNNSQSCQWCTLCSAWCSLLKSAPSTSWVWCLWAYVSQNIFQVLFQALGCISIVVSNECCVLLHLQLLCHTYTPDRWSKSLGWVCKLRCLKNQWYSSIQPSTGNMRALLLWASILVWLLWFCSCRNPQIWSTYATIWFPRLGFYIVKTSEAPWKYHNANFPATKWTAHGLFTYVPNELAAMHKSGWSLTSIHKKLATTLWYLVAYFLPNHCPFSFVSWALSRIGMVVVSSFPTQCPLTTIVPALSSLRKMPPFLH